MKLVPAAAALAGSAADAQQRDFGPLPYDYIFGNYALTELDSGGVELGGSIEVANRIHVFGAHQDWELGNNADYSALRIGGGYRWALSPRTDGVAKLAFAASEIDGPGAAPDFDADGLILSGEIRSFIAANVELSGELSLDDSLGSDLETILEFGGQYHLNDSFSVGGRLRVDDDDTTLLLGARFYFGGSVRSGRGARASLRP
jgi:hypothetical protein